VIGMELGMVYQRLGMKVIVVEIAEQILGSVDADLAKVVEKAFTKGGGELLLRHKVDALLPFVGSNGYHRLVFEPLRVGSNGDASI
ncbi:MAG: NAD-binding protein, partial [Deltaproteobacteria bacterium]|nr:NAD-binding protein [Deltaproteobacteria bacterium]